ncbi:hypothetical protein RF11_00507 [Thelohanellus kitauei]|uniref:Uncharacterized protein n=1 Tax=Thelohanellus kitauei TaxID=669202 RepID=A0A0C2N9L4_THEKT|nr:hypothetical protein RF11_00507 [Thelohanellus kitauei]
MSDQEFGPALPPQYAAKKRVYGPSLPEKPMPDKESILYLDLESSDSEYEDIGPKISEFSENTEEPDEEVEKLTSWPVKTDSCKTKKSDREDWMSLPKKVANVQS